MYQYVHICVYIYIYLCFYHTTKGYKDLFICEATVTFRYIQSLSFALKRAVGEVLYCVGKECQLQTDLWLEELTHHKPRKPTIVKWYTCND